MKDEKSSHIDAVEGLQDPADVSELRYRQLFDNMGEGVAIYEAVDDGEDFIFVDFNKAGQAMDGVNLADALGQRVSRVFPGVVDFGLLDVFRRVWLTGKPERHPVGLYQDEILVGYRSNYVYKLPGGQIVAVYSDETERLKAEEALRLKNMAFEDAISAQSIADTKGIITHVNPAFLEMWGHRNKEHAIGGSVASFFANEEDAGPVLDALAKSGRWEGEFLALRVDGSTFISRGLATSLRNEQGEVIAYQSANLDMTKQKQAEEERDRLNRQLQQSQKMESIGRLAGGVAHDFNNLLTVINNYAELLAADLRDADPMKEDILQIREAGMRAAALTSRLLAFSRKQVMEPIVFELNEVVVNMEKILRRIIGEDLDFQALLADDLGRIRADPGQIEQVLMNLAINAKDAMPQGGSLTIETAEVELDENYASQHPDALAGRFAMLAVTDTGKGMTAEVLERVFEPFYTTKDLGQGTGLGLATVYGIVKQSGGNIFVYSEPGKGTTFKVYLPLVEAEKPEQAAEVDTTNLRGKETILIVEDDKAVRDLTHRILASAGYKTLIAANGGEALLECEQHEGKIHLVLTDVVMPKMSGKELSDRLAKLFPKLKVLFMSGYTDNAIAHHGILDEGSHFISKPFTSPDLLKKIRAVLGSGVLIGPGGSEEDES
ncbi:MAG: response regulator [Deltaproteobacteria bacterium]|nr:response regulator [Deltaproteobacteria bacterium]